MPTPRLQHDHNELQPPYQNQIQYSRAIDTSQSAEVGQVCFIPAAGIWKNSPEPCAAAARSNFRISRQPRPLLWQPARKSASGEARACPDVQIFDTVAITPYHDGPVNVTRVVYYYIYELAFTHFRMGYASAVAMTLVLLLGLLTLIQMRLLRASRSELA
jgi:hypothetical protein